MNQAIIAGRLTADPIIRYTNSQLPIASFTVAVDRRKKDGDKETDFIKCTSIGSRAGFAEKWMYKGQMVCIRGSIRTGSYEKDGIKHYTTEINVEEIQPMEWKTTTQEEQSTWAPNF